MYLINTSIKVNWILSSNSNTITLASLDVIVTPPQGKGSSTVFTGGILPDNYLAYTSTDDGYAAYEFTPDSIGLWTITLTNGTGTPNDIFYEDKILIDINATVVNEYVDMTNF